MYSLFIACQFTCRTKALAENRTVRAKTVISGVKTCKKELKSVKRGTSDNSFLENTYLNTYNCFLENTNLNTGN